MKCVLCKIGTTKAGTTTFMHDDGAHVHVIRNVPAEICDACGESYFDSKTSAQLSYLIEKSDAEGVQIDIQNYIPASPTQASV